MRFRSITRTTQPTLEPVTLAEAKHHLRVDSHDDDAYIAGLVRAAREWVEEYLDRTLVLTQWTVRFDKFPPDSTTDIELPRPPMATSGAATAVSVTYTLEDGSTAAYSTASYRVDRDATPGAVKTNYGQTWPPHRQDDNSIAITYWAGYGANATDVPAAIRHAMLMLVAHWYDGARQAAVSTGAVPQDVPFGVRALLDSQRWGPYP